MAEYLIAAPNPVTAISPDQFRCAVLDAWPDAAFVNPPVAAEIVATAWIRVSEDRWDDLVLDLHATGAALSVDCRIEATIAEVAGWWRRLVDSAEDLWFFDPAGETCRSLPPDVRVDQVFRLPDVSPPTN